MSYLKAETGYDNFLDRSIGVTQGDFKSTDTLASYVPQSIEFDEMTMGGSLGDKIQVGGSNIILDGANKRIIINDGENDRVLIGFQEGGF
jgi:hypothetical protein